MRRSALALVLSALGCAAPSPEVVTIRFEGRVGDAPFECGRTYPGVGASGTEYTALDFRFYVHDVRLVRPDGTEVPVELEADGVFSDGEVALLDFEDGGECDGGNAPTHIELRGTVEAGEWTAVRFTLGVPAGRNHLDSATAPAPLSYSSMFWGWMDGYKFVRVEGRSAGLPGGTLFHLGSTGCTGDARLGTRVCANVNHGEIELGGGFDPATDVIVADLAAMFAAVDLDADAGGAPGCMSGVDDPECASLFEAAGVRPGTQTLFRLERE
jgi:uncharacterized repeat protein (TIGR04052 family)